jgi:hypothetical protein
VVYSTGQRNTYNVSILKGDAYGYNGATWAFSVTEG